MSKVLSASCENSKVTIEGVSIEATILSQGKKQSTGQAILDGEKVVYVTSNALDLKETIESLDTILGQVVTILTGLDGVSTTPGSMTAAITTLTNLRTQFSTTKDNLR